MTLKQAMAEAVRRAAEMQKAYAIYQHCSPARSGDYIVRPVDAARPLPNGWKRIAVYGEGTDALHQVANTIK